MQQPLDIRRLFAAIALLISVSLHAQDATPHDTLDSLQQPAALSDTLLHAVSDSVSPAIKQNPDSTARSRQTPVEYWRPDPQRAMWYSLLCPGLGQIYNRSYWKVPLIYGIGVACVYVVSFQGRMYNDYSNAYYSIMDSDPYTNDFQPIFAGIEGATREWQVATLKKKMDTYRRYRDLCIFGTVLLYVGNVLDAFVDAHLYDFQISDDLSLHVVPDVRFFPNENNTAFANTSFGLKFAVRY